MLELDAITGQVLENCTIADSRHAGLYSVCGLALRLRDLFKWEKGLDPWVEADSAELLEWIGEREEKWERLEEKDFGEIKVHGTAYDPFDVRGINAALESHGFLYGAGYVHSMKPTFVLANLDDRKKVNGHTVFVLGRELARDLFSVPALTQENCILIRKQSGKVFLWDRIFFIKKSGRPALRFALKEYGVNDKDPEALRRSLARISGAEMETYIYHELGEIQDTVFDRDLWREMIATFPHTPIELLARTIKDLLADTNEYGTLQHIMKERKKASLAFYVAFIDGLAKELFPELLAAFAEFTETGDWYVIELATAAGYQNAGHYAETMSTICRAGKQRNDMKWAEDEMERRLLAPLGLGKTEGADSD